MMINDTKGVGRIEVRTLQLPEYVKQASGTYTCTGKILVDYHRNDDPEIKDYIHLGLVNDNGTDFKDIYAGVIPIHEKANGIRYMVYSDNKRILLGDYVLECFPDIDQCEKTELVPVIYPWGLQEDERIFKSWSEVIISPDNEYICWTILLHGSNGAANAIGRLVREKDSYVIQNAQIISSHEAYVPNKERPGYVTPIAMRGGEVKQFVRGGTAISLVGSSKSALPDSVVQDLLTEDIMQITNLPGYEETIIFSPDEKLGLVMSPRSSAATNCAIFGLLPRPNAMLVTRQLIYTAYIYAVTGVRAFRQGNVGPVLVEIDKSIAGGDYQGAVLSDTKENWVYYSPMSWHPNNKKVMWPEGLRGSTERRLRIAELLDYVPSPTVPAQKTPSNIPYGITDESQLFCSPLTESEIKIEGKCKGVLVHTQSENTLMSTYTEYSDDGKSYFSGWEKISISPIGNTIYEADIKMTGEQTGEMKCKTVFTAISFTNPSRLLKDESYGYAEYNGVRLNVDDMAE